MCHVCVWLASLRLKIFLVRMNYCRLLVFLVYYLNDEIINFRCEHQGGLDLQMST